LKTNFDSVNRNWTTLFWDLDGTITDPRKGIIESYKTLLMELEIPIPSDEDLVWVIGPPLRECLVKLLGTKNPVAIENAVNRYRYWYVERGNMYLDTPYNGILELLSDLKNSGQRMFVATAKAHPYARLILRHWELEGYFENIHGSELDGTRSNKADLLKWIITQYDLGPKDSILMIGDRKHDALAAKSNNLSSLGVGYGYGSQVELQDAGVDIFCRDLDELRKILLR
jgi:phosphoglycolate phosphatase